MVTVIGLGFVGLTTGLGFASMGSKVFGFDNNDKRLQTLKKGNIDFEEPYLLQILNENLGKNLYLESSLEDAIKESKIIFICVGTPCQENGKVDLNYVITAVNEVLTSLPDDDTHRTLVIKSTVPPGTCKNIVEPIVRKHGIPIARLSVASNPEFLREGFCWEDFNNPGRIILGVGDSKAEEDLKQLYSNFNENIYILTPNGAEFSKYLSNVMLASMISFSNEFAYAAECFGDIDIRETFKALHNDVRLRNSGIASYIYPGCGFGGYCLPKDTRAFNFALEETGYHSNLFNEVVSINDIVTNRFCKKIAENTDISEPIGILGLSFKPDTDDVRDTPAAKVISSLLDFGANKIYAYDPLANEKFKDAYPALCINFCRSISEVLEKCSIIVITTAWPEFKNLDYSEKHLFDCRYVID